MANRYGGGGGGGRSGLVDAAGGIDGFTKEGNPTSRADNGTFTANGIGGVNDSGGSGNGGYGAAWGGTAQAGFQGGTVNAPGGAAGKSGNSISNSAGTTFTYSGTGTRIS